MATILLSGASGFIGRPLAQSFAADGHRVVPLTRSARAGADAVTWDAEAGRIDDDALRRVAPDIVIHLAGEPIAQRWTDARKRSIRDSRVNGTAALARAIAALSPRPGVLVSGSAIGIYGADRGDELLDETSAAGTDFLAETATAWERAAAPAQEAGIRVVWSRTGIVLGPDGGALARMLPFFERGLGGPLGSGNQWMSWIALHDAVRALRFMAENDVSGPVNVVAPQPVRNADFVRVLGAVLHRPAIVPAPRFALQLLYGEMAGATVLASQRVAPTRLQSADFSFHHPDLAEALAFELRRSGGPGGR